MVHTAIIEFGGMMTPLGFYSSLFTLEYFAAWQAAGLFAVLAIPILFLGVRSLAGLGAIRKWVAIGLRLAVLALVILILGGIRWQRRHHDLEVMVLRDISLSTTLVHDYPGEAGGATVQTAINNYLKEVSDDKVKPAKDRIGLISFHSDALIDAMPSERLMLDGKAIRDPGNGTDAASAIELALATHGHDAMGRMLLIWDGNATTGDLESALNAATAAHIPIDVMPLHYDVQNEVMVDRFISPTVVRQDQPFTIEVVIKSTNVTDVDGKLTVTDNNEPLNLDPYSKEKVTTRKIKVHPGTNVERVKVPGSGEGVHNFRADIDVENVMAEIAGNNGGPAIGIKQGDTLIQNNTATAFTFVRGKGKVLFIDNSHPRGGDYLRDALHKEGIEIDAARSSVDQFPTDLATLLQYDAVILANVRRGLDGLNEDQEKMLVRYVHEVGGGLVMIGGDEAFGAGGWQDSKLEQILPVDMNIPAQRQIAKGALVVIMHSTEIPDGSGNYWGEQCALKAVETLSEQDEIGVISFGPGMSQWDYPLSPKGDGTRVRDAIKRMVMGDMPSFDDSMNVALNGKGGTPGLLKSNAKQKHVIIISDGDPQVPQPALLAAYQKAKITVSTVAVYPHGADNLKPIADACKGKAYGPINGNFNQLPQIFIKEATIVRRSLIHESNDPPINLKRTPSTSDMVKGLDELPAITGMVLTTLKRSPQIECPIVAGKNNDPILAHWQTGLGKAAVFTSDAHNRWLASWVGTPLYEKFWAQVVRDVSRPAMSTDLEATSVVNGDKGEITVEALNKEDERLNFLNMRGQVISPDLKVHEVKFVQSGPGIYKAKIDAVDPGNYVMSLQYSGPNGEQGWLPSGFSVNGSPELRDLKSNDALLKRIADRTGGKVLAPFDAVKADLFRREGLTQSASPMPVWDLMIPILLALILMDIACRRIAWDWNSTKAMLAAAQNYIRGFTVTTRKVETAATLDSLKRVRGEVAEQKFKPGVEAGQALGTQVGAPRPDPTAKFEAKGVEGDISKVVGGATDKPLPSAPKKVEPKGMPAGPGSSMGGLMEAKRRAQQQIKQKEQE